MTITYVLTRELPGVVLVNISHGSFYKNSNTFVNSEMSSYARLQLLNLDSKQTTGQINLKATLVTPAGLEVSREVSTTQSL